MTTLPPDIKVLIFTEGTILMHRGAVGLPPDQIGAQVKAAEASVNDFRGNDFRGYVAIGHAVAKLRRWQQQGAQITYLTSRRDPAEVQTIRDVLQTHSFPPGELPFRQPGETYGHLAERIMPDILIEDDCQSIGGASEMTITQVAPRKRHRIRSVPVPEFAGIDHLPDELSALLTL